MAKKEKLQTIDILKAISGLDDKIAKNLDTICNEIALKNNENFKLLNEILKIVTDTNAGEVGFYNGLSNTIKAGFDRMHKHIDGHFEIERKIKDDRVERIQALMDGKGGFVEPKKPAKQTAKKKAKKSTKKKS